MKKTKVAELKLVNLTGKTIKILDHKNKCVCEIVSDRPAIKVTKTKTHFAAEWIDGIPWFAGLYDIRVSGLPKSQKPNEIYVVSETDCDILEKRYNLNFAAPCKPIKKNGRLIGYQGLGL